MCVTVSVRVRSCMCVRVHMCLHAYLCAWIQACVHSCVCTDVFDVFITIIPVCLLYN